MKKYLEIITGSENQSEIKDEILLAVINFYKAFNEGNMELMQEVWLNSGEASMNNPVGGIMRSWNEIKEVYDRIFNGEAKVYVEFYDFTLHSTENMFLITGRERGYFEKGNKKIDLAIRTSRVFIKKDNKWKQIQHHGSIDNPELLDNYQKVILNK